MNVSRKGFLKLAGAAAGGALGETAVKDTQKMERAKVYFSKLNNPRLKARGFLTQCRLSRNSQGF